MAILQNTSYEVTNEGSLVKLTFGNVPITMDHRTALKIAQSLRIFGRRAKAIAGDHSMNLNAFGLLTDAEQDEREMQAARDATATYGN